MKISKLFHWLYAFLMFLPVFFVAGRTFYTICNKNAYQSYSGNDYIEYSQATNDDIKVGNALSFINEGTYTNTSTQTTSYVGYSMISNIQTTTSALKNALENGSYFGWYYTTTSTTIYVWDTEFSTLYGGSGSNDTISFDFVLTSYNQTNIFLNLTNFRVKDINSFYNLDNAFEYSMVSINDTPLFSWAQTSFLSEPMLFITGLFGMPNNSPVITLLSYWLSISIVWLVFDLVMYVPLLVHRWIDRGIVE